MYVPCQCNTWGELDITHNSSFKLKICLHMYDVHQLCVQGFYAYTVDAVKAADIL